jgi:hypothetical protein
MWVEIYQKAQEALASGEIERFMKATLENSRDMRVSFQTTPNVIMFMSFLDKKASFERLGFIDGAIPVMVMGGNG